MWGITLRDLQFRRRRFALAVVGAAFVFAMALVMSGLAAGFRAEARKIVSLVGADAWIVASAVSGPFTATAALDAAIGDAASLGVARADPLIVVRQTAAAPGKPRRDVNLIGHRPDGLGAPRVAAGRAAAARGEVVADRLLRVPVGARLELGGRSFTVVGLTRGTSFNVGVPTAFVNVADAQSIAFGGRALVTAVVTRGTPSSAPAGAKVLRPNEVLADLLRPLANGISSIESSRMLMWVVAAFIIAVVVYLSALERTRDFAVLKAVGASSRSLYGGLAIQSVLLAVSGAVLGIGASRGLVPLFPLPVEISPGAALALPAIAVVVGLAASLVALRRAVVVDPASAFGGP